MNLGLRGRILMLVLVALAPPTAIAVIVALDERGEAREQAKADVFDATRAAAADAAGAIDATANFLNAVGEDLAASRGVAHCERLLALVPQATDWYSSVGVAGPGGRVYCGTTSRGFVRPMEPVDVSGAGWFRRAQRERGFVLGEFGAGPLSGMDVLMGSHAVRQERGKRPAVLFAALDLQELTSTLGFHHAPRDMSFVLFDNHGTVIAQVPPAGLVGLRLPERPLVQTVLARRQGTAEVEGLDGVRSMYGFAPVRGNADGRLHIAAGRSSASVFAESNHDLRRFLLLATLGLLLALAFSYAVTKLLLGRWTDEVVNAARRFGSGDLTARAPVPRNLGELTDVANALNSAAVDIERRQEAQTRLLAELVAAEEETRRRIAADIHDDTAQAVAAAGLRIDALAAQLQDPAGTRDRIERAQSAGRGEQAPAPAAVRAAPSGARQSGAGSRARAVPDRLVRTRRVRLEGREPPRGRARARDPRDPLPRGARGAHERAQARPGKPGRGAAGAPRRRGGGAHSRQRRGLQPPRAGRARRSPVTSGWSRCGSAPRRRAGASLSPVPRGVARPWTSGCPSRTAREGQSRMPRRIASATAAARSETPSFS